MVDDVTPIKPVPWLKVMALIAAVSLIIVGFGAYNVVQKNADENETNRLALIADRLEPPDTWTKTSDIRMGEYGCSTMESTCNSVSRSYDLPAELTPEDFKKLVVRVGLNPARTQGDCLADPKVFSYTESCKNEATIDGNRFYLRYGTSGPHEKPRLTLMVVDTTRR